MPILEGSSAPVPTWATVVVIAICVIAALLLLFVIGYAIYEFVIEPKKHAKKAIAKSEYTYHRQTKEDVEQLTREREAYKEQEGIFCDQYRQSVNAWVEGMKAKGYTMEQINAIFNGYLHDMFYGQSPW